MELRPRESIVPPIRYVKAVASAKEVSRAICSKAVEKTWWRVLSILAERGEGENIELLIRWAPGDDEESWEPSWEPRNLVSAQALRDWSTFKILHPLYTSPNPSGLTFHDFLTS